MIQGGGVILTPIWLEMGLGAQESTAYRLIAAI